MSTPIIETIALKLVDLINAITIANGFNQDLTAVRPKRIHLEGDLNKDNTVIIEQEDATVEQLSEDVTMWRQGFTLQALVIDSDAATAAIDTRLNQVAADILKKLFGGTNWQLESNACGIDLRGTEKFIADPQMAGIAVNIDILYRVKTDDPYTIG